MTLPTLLSALENLARLTLGATITPGNVPDFVYDFERATSPAAVLEMIGQVREMAATVRNEALEDAARTCQAYGLEVGDKFYPTSNKSCANAIRVLKSLPAPEPQQWRTMESAPRDGSLLLLGNTAMPTPCIGSWFEKSNGEGWWACRAIEVTPTHWQPLPAPPKSSPPEGV